MIKECKVHGLTEFYKTKERWRCKKCNTERVQLRRNRIKLLSIQYKGGKCEICGYNKCIAALEFHHLDPSIKEFGIGSRGYTRNWEKIKKELDKCILVCANCHREIHNIESKKIELFVKKDKSPKKGFRKVEWSKIDLLELKKSMNNSQIALLLNISETAVRKRLKVEMLS